MKHTFPASFKKPTFATCGQAEQKTASKPCVTEPLVDLVYNSYLDTMDCFDLPAKESLPKFMSESGAIPNVLQPDGSVGFVPMPADVLQILKDQYPAWSLRIRSSKKASCARLLSVKGAMPASAGHLHPMNPLTCSGHTNPIRDMIFYGAYHNILQKEVGAALEKPDVRRLMERLKIDEASERAIQKALVVMSFEPGTNAVSDFRDWLNDRVSKLPESGKAASAESFWKWLEVEKKKSRRPAQIQFFADRLKANFGEGVCTESKFLEF